MDENILNDLLECSVCLERLDTSSKVLPCQHTFCRKCLENIQSSHQELRCPECRILIEIKIEDLPSNILLMRILEGMKNNSSIKQEQPRQIKLHQEIDIQQDKISERIPSEAAAVNIITKSHQLQQHTTNSDLNKQKSKQYLLHQSKCALIPHAYAIYDYKSNEIMDLQLQRGDLILLKHQIDQNWYVGKCHNHEGAFPINHVQIVVPLPLPQCVALYDFKMGPNDEEGCLTFSKGTLIQVLRRVDMNWAEGKINTIIGIFPLAFVQLNAMAKQLLYHQYHHLHRITVPSTPSTASNNNKYERINSKLTYNQKYTNVASTHILPSNQRICNTSSIALPSNDIVGKTRNNAVAYTKQFCNNKEHIVSIADDATNSNAVGVSNAHVIYRQRRSLNSNAFQENTNITEIMQLQNQHKKRHSAEILSLPNVENGDITGDNLNEGEKQVFGNNTGLKYSQNLQQYSKSQQNLQTLQMSVTPVPDIKTSLTCVQSSNNINKNPFFQNILKKNCTKLTNPPVPWRYMALHSYMPKNSNELELKKGCIYVVTERCSNGWFKGNNWLEMKGIFPGNYVIPLKWSDEQQPISNWRMINDVHIEGNRDPPVNCASLADFDTVNNNLIRTVSQIVPPLRNAKDVTKKKDMQDKEKHITIGCLATSVSSSSSTSLATHTGIGLKNLFNHLKGRSKSPNSNDSGSESTGSIQVNENANAQSNSINPIGITSGKVVETTSMHPTTSAAITTSDTAITRTSHLQHTPSALHIRSGSCPSQLLCSESSYEKYMNFLDSNTISPPRQLNKSSSSARHESNEKHPSLHANIVCTDTTFSTMYVNQLKQHQKIVNRDRIGVKPHMSDSNYQQYIQQQSQQQVKSGNNINTNGSFHKSTKTIINHQKSHSLDTSNILHTTSNAFKCMDISQIYNRKESCASAINKPNNNPAKGPFRCITAYSSNNDVELDLQVGDVIHINCESENGWYKGTNSRTQKTGLLPVTFVEPASSNMRGVI